MNRLREWLNENPAAGAVMAGSCLLIVIYMLFIRSGNTTPPTPTEEWFYNIATGELVAMAKDTIPPVTNEQTHELVQAYVYACDCSKTETIEIGWLEKFTPQGKVAQEKARKVPESKGRAATWEENEDTLDEGRQRAEKPQSPGQQPRWIKVQAGSGDTDPATELMKKRHEAIKAKLGCERLSQCFPPVKK